MTGSVRRAYRAELRKLRGQRRAWLGLAAAAAFPLLYAIALNLVTTKPDVVYGEAVRSSGLVLALVVLSYGAKFAGVALITGLVAGDVFAAEDQGATWKTILTRSCRRSEIFVAKILAVTTYSVLAVGVMGVVAFAAGSAAWGIAPIGSLAGVGNAVRVVAAATIPAVAGLGLVPASYAIYVLPVLGVVAFAMLLSILTRNSAASIVGTLLYAFLSYGLVEALPDQAGVKTVLIAST